jgi:hypothetical protein
VAFEVVGVAQSAYEKVPAVLAAPGTWASLPPSAARAREGLAATPIVLTDERGLATVINAASNTEGDASVVRRSQAEAETFWVTESPFSFYVPALLLPCMASIFGFLVSAPRRRRIIQTATSVGMQAQGARLLAISPLIVMAPIGLLAGLVLGTVLGVGGRRVVAAQVPYVSSMPPILVPCLVLSASLLAGVVAGALVALRPESPPSASWRLHVTSEGAQARSTVRRFAGLLLGCVTVFALFRVDNGQSAMVFGACLLATTALLLPDVLRAVSRLISERGPRLRLARRLLLEGGSAQAAATGISCVVLALPLSTAILLTANGVLDRSGQLAGVGPGQLAVQGRGGLATPAPRAVRSLVQNELVGSMRTTLWFSGSVWYDVPEGNALVAIVDTPEDVERVWGNQLTEAQADTLISGGLLTWQPGAELLVDDKYVNVPATAYSATPEWETQTGAILLSASAKELGIRPRPGVEVYSGVSSQQAKSVEANMVAAGLDPGAIETHTPPEPLLPPAPLIVSAALLLATLVVMLFAANRLQARSLRQEFSALIAIGAGPKFARRTFLIVQAVTLGVALGAATAVTWTTCSILLLRAPSVEISVPWGLILIGIVTCAGALWLSTRLALRGLSGHDEDARRLSRRPLHVMP